MLAAQVVVGPGMSVRVDSQFADLEALALERTGNPPGSLGAHESPGLLLHAMMSPGTLNVALPLEAQVSRFPVSFLMGRMVWQVAIGTTEGLVPISTLQEMQDPGYAEDLVGAGWNGVLADQRGDRRWLADLLTDDEAALLPVEFLPELLDRRTMRSSEAEAAFRFASNQLPGVAKETISRLVDEIFISHPHWREDR